MESVLEIIKKIERHQHETEVRVLRRVEIGSCAAHQGDVYIHCVAANHPKGKQIGKNSVQIALGTGNGARHMAEGKVRVYEGKALPKTVTPMRDIPPEVITGPVIVADEPWTLKHPEHAHHTLPAGVYQVTYQMDARTMQRVRD